MAFDLSSPISSLLVVKSDKTKITNTLPAGFWGFADFQEHWRKEQQRERMARYRVQKKGKVIDMNRERLELENELRLSLDRARTEADNCRLARLTALGCFQQLTIETAALRSENIALRGALARYSKLDSLLQRGAQEMEKEFVDTPPLTSLLSSRDALAVYQDKLGWRVFFPNDAPSFHFHPFSREKFDAALKRNDRWLREHPCSATVGTLFGWAVDYTPPTRKSGGSVIAHAKFSRRLNCSLDQVQKTLPRSNKNTWPVIVAPRSWGRTQCGKMSYQTLQNFDEFAHVLVCHIPGDIHLRYVAVAQYTRETLDNGKRVDLYSISLTESNVSQSNEDIQQGQDVQWVTDGGMLCTFTEVDENTTDVTYHHWAGCLNERLGRELYVDWVRFAVLLEQYVSSARLLAA